MKFNEDIILFRASYRSPQYNQFMPEEGYYFPAADIATAMDIAKNYTPTDWELVSVSRSDLNYFEAS